MSNAIERRVIAEGLYEWDAEGVLRLRATRCQVCKAVSFPSSPICLTCASDDVTVDRLAPTGHVWTWSVQTFPPKPPYGLPEDTPFEPYVVGYVSLDDEILVESLLVGVSAGDVEIGMPVRTTETVLWREDGRDLVTYAFEPATSEVAR